MVHKFASLPKGYTEIHEFYNNGHLMFLYEAEKFNSCLAGFMHKVFPAEA